MNKFWERIWGQGNQKQDFGVKNSGFPRDNPRTGYTCLVQLVGRVVARCGELLSVDTHVFGVPGVSGPIRTVQTDSFDVFICLYAF